MLTRRKFLLLTKICLYGLNHADMNMHDVVETYGYVYSTADPAAIIDATEIKGFIIMTFLM